VYVGVSGSYRFAVHYQLAGSELFGTARIFDDHNNEVDDSPVRLFNKPEAKADRDQTLSLTVTLNAGNYDFELGLPNADGLSVDSLAVQ
jgi:hypothetical protein